MLNAAIGHVSAIDQVSPAEKVHVDFKNQKIFEWLPIGKSLSSAWMEIFKPATTITSSLDVEIEDFVRNSTATSVKFFFRAVHSGNLSAVKTLNSLYRVDINALEDVKDGMSALQLASKHGYLDLVQWLLIDAKANLDLQDKTGSCAIHYAVKR